jgi:hypothetical protein
VVHLAESLGRDAGALARAFAVRWTEASCPTT